MITANRDAALVGSSLSAGHDVLINAGRDANILGGTNTSSHSKETFASGFGVEGVFGLNVSSVFLGYQQIAAGRDKAETRTAPGQITANNNLTIKAGQNITMSGSRLAAAQDLSLTAGKDLNLLQAADTEAVSAYEQKLRAGLTLSLSQNLTTNAQNLYTSVKGMNTVGTLGDGVSGAGKIIDSGESLFGSKAEAGLSLGVSASWSSSQSHSARAVPDQLSAGRDMTLAAGQDLTLQGTQALAGRDMTLAAGRDLSIHAAESTGASRSDGGSLSASLGLQASAGTSGYSLTLSGKLGLSGQQAQGDWLTYSNAKLVAGEKLTTVSGQDTTVAGANLTAKDVDMYVGRDLTVASLQDTASSSSSSYNVGGGYTVGYGAGWDPFKSVDGADISKATGMEGYGESMANALEQVLNDRKSATVDPSQSLKENMGGMADTLFNTGQQNPSGKYKEQYQAGVSGSVAQGQSKAVGEQTSILGSESVNIYTEGNTHVAGAIIAALNDNLKLDTGTLSYENLVGKTTSTSTSAGVNWTYSPAQQGDGKGSEKENETTKGSDVGKQPTTGTSSDNGKTPSQSGQEVTDNTFKHTPNWLETIILKQNDIKKLWTEKKAYLYGVSPGKFGHTEQETIQTAYATIGKGEIIVRNNPGQSLDGLNRDPSQAMKTEQTKDVNIELKPAFSYVDDLLNLWGGPTVLKRTIDFFTDPKTFLNDLQDNIAKSIPLLKRPTPQGNPITPSTPGSQAAEKH